jgi:hypothetical protein
MYKDLNQQIVKKISATVVKRQNNNKASQVQQGVLYPSISQKLQEVEISQDMVPCVTFCEITPMDAENILENYGGKNRKVSQKRVVRLAKTIKEGEFRLNYQTMIFARADQKNPRQILIDGQHRLKACVLSNKPIKSLVAMNVPLETFLFLDDIKGRSSADLISIDSPLKSAEAAAVSKMLFMLYEHEVEFEYYHKNGVKDSITPKEIVEFFNTQPGILDSIKKVAPLTKEKLGMKSVMAACHYHFKNKIGMCADDFLEGVMYGVGLKRNSPAYHLRDFLLKAYQPRFANASTPRIPDRVKTRACIIAWNAYANGQTFKNKELANRASNMQKQEEILRQPSFLRK